MDSSEPIKFTLFSTTSLRNFVFAREDGVLRNCVQLNRRQFLQEKRLSALSICLLKNPELIDGKEKADIEFLKRQVGSTLAFTTLVEDACHAISSFM